MINHVPIKPIALVLITSAQIFAAEPSPKADAQKGYDPFAGKTFEQLVFDASRAFQAGDFDRAIALDNVAIAMDVDSGRASAVMMNRGTAYGQKGDLDRALQDLDMALKFNPLNDEAYRNRGVLWAKKGEFEKAGSDFDEAIRINPRYWRTYLSRSELFAHDQRFTEALDDVTKAIEYNSQNADAYAIRAAIYLRQNKSDKAIADASRAIELEPNSVRAYVVRTNANIRLKRRAEANHDLDAIRNLKSRDSAAPQNAIAWLRATCPDEAMRDGRKAVEAATKACAASDWKKPGYIDTLSAAFAETGDFEQAIKYEQQALQMMDPTADDREIRKRLTLYQQHKPYRTDPQN